MIRIIIIASIFWMNGREQVILLLFFRRNYH